jgi:ABC-type polysaccharide/polyol phosphate transport system ATPase subunit
LANIYCPTTGQVTVRGKISPFLELGVGFQPELTAWENIYLYGTILGLSERDIDKKIEEIVAFAELEKFLDTKVKNFSSGMFVRLAFSVAIQANFDVLLLDEVLAVGDAAFQAKCFDRFYKFKEQGKTIVFVTHDLESVNKFCNKCIWLDQGKIKEEGSSNSIINKYRLNVYGREDNKGEQISKKEKWVNRRGSGEITIESVEIKQDEQKTKVVSTGKKVKLIIGYKINKSIEPVNFGIGVYSRGRDEYCFGINTKMDEVNINLNNQANKITLEIPDFPLLAGDYYVNVVAFGNNEQKPYDFIGKRLFFKVVSKEKYRGLVNLPHQWRIGVKK